MSDPAKTLQRLENSATGAALVRAYAALEPDLNIRNPDTMAHRFLAETQRPDSNNPETIVAFRGELERILPGAYHFQNSRTHHIDSCMRQAIKDGFKQFVLLGAGFDSRAYRFAELAGDLVFIEVDMPALQDMKKSKIEATLGCRPKQVHYAGIDFNNSPLTDILKLPCYDHHAKTFFNWEGVSYYLQPHGVDATLAFIAEHSGPGSRVIFDYMPDTMIDGSGDFYGGVESRAHMAKMGEPLLFGIADNGIERFLEDRGFRPLSLMTPETLEQRYLIMTNGTLHGKVAGYVRMAEAEVQQKL